MPIVQTLFENMPISAYLIVKCSCGGKVKKYLPVSVSCEKCYRTAHIPNDTPVVYEAISKLAALKKLIEET